MVSQSCCAGKTQKSEIRILALELFNSSLSQASLLLMLKPFEQTSNSSYHTLEPDFPKRMKMKRKQSLKTSCIFGEI